ncbi:MAG: hypothetical protein K0S65_6740, partial [Labilithrix sp.]|nr:hypothetical protein [Labilithrix sp.]
PVVPGHLVIWGTLRLGSAAAKFECTIPVKSAATTSHAADGVNGHRSLRDCGLPKFPTLAGWRLLVISRCRDRLWSFLVGDRGVVAPVAV